MFRKYALPVAALAMLAFAIAHALYIQRPDPQTPPPVPPPQSPFGDMVAGAGIVEPSFEASTTSTIAIGSQLAGAVTKVWVRIGQQVKIGDLLFELDQSQTKADLEVRKANVKVCEAQIEVASANLREALDIFERNKKLRGTGAVSEQDLVTSDQAYQSVRAQLTLAKANLIQAKAQVDQDETQIELMKIKALSDGTILQVNLRPGEYVSTFGGQSLIMLGSLQPLHVRVNVDQEDLPRLKLNAPAKAKIRGDVQQEEIPMTFVRLEPYVVPKTSLTGANTERVDTRCVQLIYAVDADNHLVKEKKVLVGQLLDVFIDTRASSQPTGQTLP